MWQTYTMGNENDGLFLQREQAAPILPVAVLSPCCPDANGGGVPLLLLTVQGRRYGHFLLDDTGL